MGSLDSRLKSLETRAHAMSFPWADRRKAWGVMVDRARAKLVGLGVLLEHIPEPSAAWLAEMQRDVTSEDIGEAREKLCAKFPNYRAQLEALSDVEVYALKWDWPTWARQSQLLPRSDQIALEDILEAFSSNPSTTENTP